MRLTRILVVAGIMFATIVLAPAAPAAAHVTVSPTTVTAGGRATLTFKMPNERDDAKTIQLEVMFPENAALTSVSLKPVPGWAATVNRRGESVTGIIWRSETGVGVNEYQTFDVGLGPLPKEPVTLIFKALQTYSSGEVVRWIEVAEDGAPKPAHPAMVVTVAVAAAPAAPPAERKPAPIPEAGLAIAVLALGVSVAALRRRAKP